jgi:hypothetical protein
MGRYRFVHALLAAALCAGCGAQKPYQVGQSVKGRGFEITIHSVSKQSAVRVSASLDPLAGALAGDAEQFIVIEATVANPGGSAAAFDAGAVEASMGGRRMLFDRETIVSSEYLYAQKIDARGSLRKKIVFRLPREAQPPFSWRPAKQGVRLGLPDPTDERQWLASATVPPRAAPARVALAKAPAPEAPLLAYQMPYSDARTILLEAGWHPSTNGSPEKLAAGAKALFMQGIVEVNSCTDTGIAACKFEWSHTGDSHRLAVFTEGDKPKVFGWAVE